jgi:flagellar biosynthesis/type III secretory pathway protein FliH
VESPYALAVAGAGLAAADAAQSVLYCQLVFGTVPTAVRKQLEELMERGQYSRAEIFARTFLEKGEAKGRAEGEAKGRAEGEAKGRAEGEVKGRAAALRRIALARDLVLLPEHEARISATTELETLELWIERACVARSANEIFA